jgi:fluoride exporter
MQWLAIAVGGAAGAMARHGLWLGTTKLFGSAFPWGTFVVNVIGCALIGVVFVAIDEHPSEPELRAFLMTGVLGGFTTFSAFALDAHGLTEAGYPARAALYAVASVGSCLAACWLGAAMARRLF